MYATKLIRASANAVFVSRIYEMQQIDKHSQRDCRFGDLSLSFYCRESHLLIK